MNVLEYGLSSMFALVFFVGTAVIDIPNAFICLSYSYKYNVKNYRCKKNVIFIMNILMKHKQKINYFSEDSFIFHFVGLSMAVSNKPGYNLVYSAIKINATFRCLMGHKVK